MFSKKKPVFKLVVCAMLVALASLCKLLSIDIMFAGFLGLRMTLGGVFVFLTLLLLDRKSALAIIAVAALGDVFGYLLKPEGAYIPWLTLTAALGGFLQWLCWYGLGLSRLRRMNSRWTWGIVGLLAAVGLWNTGTRMLFPSSAWFGILGQLNTRLPFVLWAPFILAFAIAVLAILDAIFGEKAQWGMAFRVWPAVTISLATVSLLNSWILLNVAKIPLTLVVFSLPRLIEALILSVVVTYFVTALYAVLKLAFGDKTPGEPRLKAEQHGENEAPSIEPLP